MRASYETLILQAPYLNCTVTLGIMKIKISCFNQKKNVAVEKYLRATRSFYRKTMSSSYHMELKILIKASCSNIMHIGENRFCSCYFERFVSRFLSNNAKNLSRTLVCASLLWFSREDKTK